MLPAAFGDDEIHLWIFPHCGVGTAAKSATQRCLRETLAAYLGIGAGDLRIEELREDELHRYVRTATLWRDMEILHRAERPTLYDVRIIAMTPQALPSPAARKKRSKRAAPS